jgi:Fatty acid desaturase
MNDPASNRLGRFIQVEYPEPHISRTRQILQAHPEVKKLFGKNPSTALYAFGIVALQILIAALLRHSPWWLIALLAYLLGAFANHALFVIIHECTHHLVFIRGRDNRFVALFANLPQVFPSAMAFFKYHLLHHRYQGDPEMDADLPSPTEIKWVGNHPGKKALFLLFFFLVEAVRPAQLKKVKLIDAWFMINVALQIAFCAGVFFILGGKALAYLTLSTIFGIGLHPLGARWIQEHYVVQKPQETYSYYGPLNRLCFNVGFHNEHHDFMAVPWTRLPDLKRMAPEFYENLHSHRSWTRLLYTFIADPEISLLNRVTRNNRGPAPVKESPLLGILPTES